MSFIQKLQAVAAKLNISIAKVEDVTDEQFRNLDASFKDTYGMTIAEAMQQDQSEENKPLTDAQQTVFTQMKDAIASGASIPGISATGTGEPSTFEAAASALVAQATALQNLVLKMGQSTTEDNPFETKKASMSINGFGNTDKFLFGIEAPMFSMDYRWNQVAANPAFAKLNEPNEKTDGPEFRSAFSDFSAELSKRYKTLGYEGKLNAAYLSSAQTDFSRLTEAGLGDQFVSLRQDALIARLLDIPTVTHLFPVRYGIQDRELITNAFFDEMSQAYQEGGVFKGGVTLEPEMGYVDDAMMKTRFGSMKDIERKYIAYLNTSGSDPIKWSMIEWQLLNMYKVMINEQNVRRVMGCYIKPEAGKPGSYLNSATGVVYTLLRYNHECKLRTFDDESYRSYTSVTMLDSVKTFIEDVKSKLDMGVDIKNFAIYLNESHQDWWLQCCRKAYGQQQDFTGLSPYLTKVPDTNIEVKWVPNMGQLKLMFMQAPGNIMLLEFVAGEMLSISFDSEMEVVRAWSNWKEGASASHVGPSFKTIEEMDDNDYAMQQIFMNKPFETVQADATTIQGKDQLFFLTSNNSQETVITDIVGAKRGHVYIIECGGITNASKITNTEKFSTISSAYTPTKVGDYIMISLNSEGKFIELERRVGGTRTINKQLQPNIPGAR